MSSPAAKISLSRARVLSSRSRFASGSCSFLAVHSHGQTRTGRGRRDGGFAPRADGINFEGFPYVIARKAGFDTSKGILGFTPFAELFVGRTAMGGFVVGALQEFMTGDGILAQLGFRNLPSDALLQFILAFQLGSFIAGTFVTINQFRDTDSTEFNREFYRFVAKNRRALVEGDVTVRVADAEGRLLATEFAEEVQSRALSQVTVLTPMVSFDMWNKGGSEAKEFEPNSKTTPLKRLELIHARWAMLGWAGVVIIEASTGLSIGEQLLSYTKLVSGP